MEEQEDGGDGLGLDNSPEFNRERNFDQDETSHDDSHRGLIKLSY